MHGHLIFAAVLCVTSCSSDDVTALHPADDPHWFGTSPFSAGDLEATREQALLYQKEGLEQQAWDHHVIKEDQLRRHANQVRVHAASLFKMPQPGSMKLKPELASKLQDLEDCNAALRTCLGNADMKATTSSDSSHFQAPGRRLLEQPGSLNPTSNPGIYQGFAAPEPTLRPVETKLKRHSLKVNGVDTSRVKSTAVEDWERDRQGLAPPSADTNTQVTSTAVEEYGSDKEKEEYKSNELEHTSFTNFNEHTVAMQKIARARKLAVDELEKTKDRNERHVKTQYKIESHAGDAELAAELELAAADTESTEEQKSLRNAAQNAMKCKRDLKACAGR